MERNVKFLANEAKRCRNVNSSQTKLKGRGLLIVVFVLVKCLTMIKVAELKVVNNKIEKKEEQIQEYESSTWYIKFLAVKSLEEKTVWMLRYERIEKISEILEDLRNMNDDEDFESTLVLSDFYVSLEEISLNGL